MGLQLNSAMTNWPRLNSSSKVPSLEAIRDERCKRDPLYWAQRWTKTENPHYLQQGLEYKAPFPDKPYFKPVFQYLKTETRLFIPKSREMLTSWSVMIYAANRAQWWQAEVVVQTDSEEKAKELVGYARCLYENQPEWLRKRHALSGQSSSLNIEWASGGRIFGIPHGEHKLRLYHPTVYVMDEAAFLPEAEQCFNVALPVCKQIIAISSAGPGWFGGQCSQ